MDNLDGAAEVRRELLESIVHKTLKMLREEQHWAAQHHTNEVRQAHGRRCAFAARFFEDCLRLSGYEVEPDHRNYPLLFTPQAELNDPDPGPRAA